MSRIEKSLEKAMELRKSLRAEAGQEVLYGQPGGAGADKNKFEPGELLIDPAAVDEKIVCIREPNGVVTEQYKKLRARVLKATSGEFLNTVMVTSAGMGEGKTITAINLAVAVAAAIDHTVLLVDADLRKPSVHRYLGLEPERGLSDYLKGEASLSSVLIKTGIGRLVFLPAGKNHADNAAELLSSENMKGLVRELKTRYSDRYIIFDSSPLLATADPISLAEYMDGILMVVKAGHTNPATANKALSMIKGSRVLGVVFNDAPGSLKGGYPYYAYGPARDGAAGKNL